MENEVQAVETPIETSTPQDEVSNEQVDAPDQADAPPPVVEKMIPQSQVNKIAAREARAAYEKGQREAQARYEREIQANQKPIDTQAPTIGGMPQYSPEQLQKAIREQAHMMTQEAIINKIANEFETKIENAKLEDSEFEDKYEALNMTAHPKTILWVNELENTADVIREMADNPVKYANILTLANNGLDKAAQKELQKISASIKANKVALSAKQPNEPLSHLKSSNIGSDNGDSSVEDFMKMSWLRG